MTVVQISRRERKKLELRDRICDETARLVARHGVEGTTIDAICDCADIAKKTFYNYYSSKHDLLIDICQSRLLNRTEQMVSAALTRTSRLDEGIDIVLSEIAANNRRAGKLEKQLIDYLVANMGINRNQGADQLSFMNRCFLRFFSSADEQIRPGLSAAFCAEMTVGMVNTATLNWLHNDDYKLDLRLQELAEYIKHSMLVSASTTTQ